MKFKTYKQTTWHSLYKVKPALETDQVKVKPIPDQFLLTLTVNVLTTNTFSASSQPVEF